MADRITRTTHQSWFSRIKSSISGILVGLALVLGSFVLLFWNEGRAVKTHKMLQEGAGIVVTVDSQRVDPRYEGRLVHMTGMASTDEKLTDPLFRVSVTALRLTRQVEMLQWHESRSSKTSKKLGGGTETVTTYSYAKKWSANLIVSSGFQEPAGHRNPDGFIIKPASWQAKNVRLGAFRLNDSQISAITTAETLPLSKENRPDKDVAGKGRVVGGVMYFGSKKHERTGDIRVSLQVVKPVQLSVIARQTGEGFTPYKTEAGGQLQMLQTGTATAEQMFKSAEAGNTMLTWLLRFVGLGLMVAGFKLILRVFSVLADIVPLFGSIIGAGTGLIAFLTALILSLTTIAIAWVFYRPLVGGALLAVAVIITVFMRGRLKKAPAISTDPA
jgi:hypothetical protein